MSSGVKPRSDGGGRRPLPHIFGSLASTFTRAVCMLCLEKGIEYRLIEVPLGSPELRAIGPLGQMPGLRHGNFTLFESKAIATYLDTTFPHPRLIPQDSRRLGQTEQWVSFVNTHLDPLLIRNFLVTHIRAAAAGKSVDIDQVGPLLTRIRADLEFLDRSLEAGFLVGGELTFADLNLAPLLDRMTLVPSSRELLQTLPNLSDFHARMSSRGSFRATIPPPGPPPRFATDHAEA
ncbi:MAG: glutathione S-transferase family protein [Proteobacteria bacterium]|nr:glutathione S-transferase family protein [Pseudomonadota bacterium]